MPYQITNDSSLEYVQVILTGEVSYQNHQGLIQELSNLSKSDTTALLMTFIDFEKMTLGAVDGERRKEDMRIDRFDRVAIVADVGAQKAIATLIQPFASAESQFFDHTHAEDAVTWLAES